MAAASRKKGLLRNLGTGCPLTGASPSVALVKDEQPSLIGLTNAVTVDKSNFSSAIGFADVPAFKLALAEDVHGLNQLDALVEQGHVHLTLLYTYRSCVKAVPQVPFGVSQLYEATFAILRVEVERLMGVQTFQAAAARQLCINMQRFTHTGRHINGPSIAHKWLMLRLLDTLLLLDCVKNSKPSLATDFAWYKGLFAQVADGPDAVNPEADNNDQLQAFLTNRFSIITNLRAEMGRLADYDDILTDLLAFCLDTLEADAAATSRDRVLIGYDRHVLLRAVPTLLVLATPTEKQGDKLGRQLQPTRCQQLFRRWPVIPAIWDLHVAPAAIVMELSPYFDRLANLRRFDVRPPRDEKFVVETQARYLLVNKAGDLKTAHDGFCCRLSAAVAQIRLQGSAASSPSLYSTVLDLILEGLVFLTDCALAISEQSAWKYAYPASRAPPRESKKAKDVSDYERAVRCNYAPEEKTALLRVLGYLKGVGSALEQSLSLLSPFIFAGIFLDVQKLVQETVRMGASARKADVAPLLEQLRAVLGEFTPAAGAVVVKGVKMSAAEARVVRPSAAQIYAVQFLLEELVRSTPPPSSPAKDPPSKEMLTWQRRFSRLPHALDIRAHLTRLTDVSQLWFREFYLERAGSIQFSIDCSLPWILTSHALASPDPSLVDSALLPFDIYKDAGNAALYSLKQRHLYDESEAEVDLCFDQAVYKLGEHVFGSYKREAARQVLDPALIAAAERLEDPGSAAAGRPFIRPRYFWLFKQTHLQLLGRSVDVTSLLRQRISRLFRDNLDFLLERFESTGLSQIVHHSLLIKILERAHFLLSEELELDDFAAMLAEANESVSMASFSSRVAAQVWTDIRSDLLPAFQFNSATQRFVPAPGQLRLARTPIPHAQPYFLAGSSAENAAAAQLADLSAHFVGGIHMDAVVEVLGKQGLPWLIDRATQHLKHLVTVAFPIHARLLFPCAPIPFIPLSPYPNETGPGTAHVPPTPSVPFTPPHGTGNESAHLPDIAPTPSLLFIPSVPPNGTGTGTAREVFSALEVSLTPLLMHPNLEGALQVLKEIGNLLAMVSLLDEAMQSKETRQVLSVAPFIGIFPGREGRLQQLVGRGDTAGAPITGLIDRALAGAAEQMSAEQAEAGEQCSRASRAAETVYTSCVTAGSLITHCLTQLRSFLEPFHTEWAPPLGSGRPDLATLYAALHVALCLPVKNGPSEPRWHRLGDSVTLGGLSLVHCLGLTQRWKLADLTRGIARQGASGGVGNRRSSGGGKGKEAAVVAETVLHLARVSQRSLAFLSTHAASSDLAVQVQLPNGCPSSKDGFSTPVANATAKTPETPPSAATSTPRDLLGHQMSFL